MLCHKFFATLWPEMIRVPCTQSQQFPHSSAQRYTERLSGLGETPAQFPGTDTIWPQYTIQLPRRDGVTDHLRACGIPTQIYYPLPM
jgi:dTDP-4-amino-4,6-dideoxygalactose transaminase